MKNALLFSLALLSLTACGGAAGPDKSLQNNEWHSKGPVTVFGRAGWYKRFTLDGSLNGTLTALNVNEMACTADVALSVIGADGTGTYTITNAAFVAGSGDGREYVPCSQLNESGTYTYFHSHIELCTSANSCTGYN